jgi:YHS domain-containing protein
MITTLKEWKKFVTKLNEKMKIFESAEGKTYYDYSEWKQDLFDKYPLIDFVNNGDTEGAYLDSDIVGHWDTAISSGIIYDMNLVDKS